MSSDNQVRVDIVGDAAGLKPATQEAKRELDDLKQAAGGAAGGLDAVAVSSRAMLFGLGAATAAVAAGAAAWLGYEAAQVAAAMAIKDTADETGKLEQRLGMSAERISELRYVANMTNVSMGEMTGGVKALANQMQSALAGNRQSIALFEALDIKLRTTSGQVKGLDQVFREVSDRFSGYADGATKTALANDVFGRGVGEKLIPLLNGGAEGLREMGEEARQLGAIYDADLIRQSSALNDNLTRLQTAVDGAKIAFGRGMMPTLVDITYWMTESAKQGRLLEGVILGLGAAVVKAFGGEINPLKIAERDAGEKFAELAEELKKLQSLEEAAKNRSTDTSIWNLWANDRAQAELTEQRTRVAELRGELESILKTRDKLAEQEAKASASGKPSTKPDAPTPSAVSEARKDELAYLDQSRRLASQAEKEWAALQKQQDEWAKISATTEAAFAKETARLKEQVAKEEEHIALLGLTTEQQAELIASKLELAAAAQDEYAANLENAAAYAGPFHDAYNQAAQDVRAQADALRELAGLKRSGAAKEAGIEQAREYTRAWDRFWGDIERGLTDSLYRGFEAGKSFGENFVDSLKYTLKTAGLKLVVQALVSPVMGGVQSLLGGNVGAGGTVGGGLNMLSAGNNAYNLASSASTFFGLSGYGAAGGTLAAANLVGAAGGDAMGALIAGNATNWGVSAAGVSGGGALSAFGTAFPYIAAATALLSMMDWGGGTPHKGANVFSSGANATSYRDTESIHSAFAVKEDAYNFNGDRYTTRFQQDMAAALTPMAQGMASSFNAILRANGLAGGYTVGLGFAADGDTASSGVMTLLDSARNEVIDFKQRFAKDAAQGMADFGAEAQRALLDALEGMALNDLADTYLDGLDIEGLSADAAAQALQFVQASRQIIDAFKQLGLSADAVSLDLINALGGLDAAGASLSAYYAAMYTDEERRAYTMGQIEAEFARWNATVPTTVAGWRALTEQVAASGPANADALAALIKYGPAFAEVKAATEGATDSADEYAAAQTRAAKAQQDAIAKAIDAAYATLERSVDHEMDLIAAQRDALSARVTDIAAIYEAATGGARALLGQVSSLSGQRITEARAYIDMAQSLVRAGELPNQERLASAIDALRADSIDNYASFADFEYAQLVQARKLEDIARVTGDQKSVAQRQLDELDTQTDLLEAQLQAARDQVDAFNGLDTTLLSVAAAIAGLEAALVAGGLSPSERRMPGYSATVGQWQAASAGNQLAAGIAAVQAWDGSDIARDQVATALASNSLASVAAAWNAQTGANVTADDVKDWAHAAGIQGFDVGINRVPRDMLALIHKDEAVLPAPFNPWAGGALPTGGYRDSAELVQAVRDLAGRLDKIETAVRQPVVISQDSVVRTRAVEA